MSTMQLKELLLQSLVHERGGVLLYRTALECVRNADLRKEWQGYLAQTENHVLVLTVACEALGFDANEITPGCQVVHHTGKSLVIAMKMALAAGDPIAAELVACDCIVLAETKDHANWQLIGACAKAMGGRERAALQNAYDQVEDEEDEHLYHTKGWCRELRMKALGLKATLPPAEERRDVRSAIDAATAERDSKKGTKSKRRA